MKEFLDKIINTVLLPFTPNINTFEDMYEGLFSEIRSNIYLGGRPDEITVPELKRLGITHVVSCLDEENRSSMAFLEENFHHLFLGVHDGIYQDIAGRFPQFFDFTVNLTDPKLFVHCESGVSRSAALVIAQLMKLEKIRFFDAYKSVKSKRYQVLPTIGFASQLQCLEDDLIVDEQADSPSSLALYLHQVCKCPADVTIIQSMLEQNGFDAVAAIKVIFNAEIPRVMQGVKL